MRCLLPRIGRILLAGLFSMLATLLVASPALAHTSLASSSPSAGEVLPETPKQVVLDFTAAPDPQRFVVRLVQRDGVDVRLSGQGPRFAGTQVSFDLPILDMGTYAVVWKSTDASGHLSAGQVLFSVGSESGMQVDLDSGKPWWIDLLGNGARLAAFAGAALLLGVWLVAAWSRRRRPAQAQTGTASEEPAPDQGGQGQQAWQDRLNRTRRLAAAVTAAGLVLMPVGALASVASVAGLSTQQLVAMYTTPPNAYGWWFLLVALVLVALVPRLPQCALPAASAVVLGDALAGHLSATAQGPILVPLVSAHLAAAITWLGVPLAWVLVRPPGGYRWLLARFTPLALACLALVALSGPAMWLVRTGSADALVGSLSGTYGQVLIAKTALVLVVVVPLGLVHLAWKVRSSYARALARQEGREPSQAELAEPRHGMRAVRAEAVALAVILAAGAALAGMSPSPARAQDQDASLFVVASSWDECINRSADWEDRILCLDTYLEHVVADDSAAAALKDLNARTDAGDTFALQNCHELSHKIGRAAWIRYQSLTEAMKQGQDNCDFGFMHGIIEGFSLGVADADLVPALAQQCDALPFDRSDHQVGQCYHGIGHAVARRLNLRMTESFDQCKYFSSPQRQQSRADYWGQEFLSCGTGVIMEWTLRPGFQSEAALPIGAPGTTLDLCRSVDEVFQEACFEYVTSPINSDVDKLVEVRDWCYQNLQDPVACYRSIGRDLMWLTFNSGGDLTEQESIQLCYHGDNQDAITACLRWQLGSIVTIYHAIEPLDRACTYLDPGRQRSLCPGMRESMLKALAANQRGEDSVAG